MHMYLVEYVDFGCEVYESKLFSTKEKAEAYITKQGGSLYTEHAGHGYTIKEMEVDQEED